MPGFSRIAGKLRIRAGSGGRSPVDTGPGLEIVLPWRYRGPVIMDVGTANDTAWHSLDSSECLSLLDSRADTGLSAHEARRRLLAGEANRLIESGKRGFLALVKTQLVSPLVVLLLLAALLAAIVGEGVDAMAILVIVVLNAILGLTQEGKAERALQELAAMLAPQCQVIRDGHRVAVPAEDLVVGDLVALEAGDRVPADLRILESLALDIDESVLTGESVPVHKSARTLAEDVPLAERRNLAYMGTGVTHGHGKAVVVATGMGTEFGRVAGLTTSVVDERSPLYRKLTALSKSLGILALGASFLVLVIGLLTGNSLFTMVMTAISLAVAVVPEGLAAVVTVTLALGARAMAHRHALLRHLQAAESLGEATVICTDKTGTLTENVMKVERVLLADQDLTVSGQGYEPTGGFHLREQQVEPEEGSCLEALLTTGVLCNNAEVVEVRGTYSALGRPTEAALIAVASKAGLRRPDELVVIEEVPFDPDRKLMTRVTMVADRPIGHVKGAPEVVLSLCSRQRTPQGIEDLDDEARARWHERLLDLSSSGMRTLALAQRPLDPGDLPDPLEEDLVLLGFVGIHDPPRKEVPEALREARQAGIRVFMITGDSAATASAIGKLIGLEFASVVTGSQLEELSDLELDGRLAEGVLFARTVPHQKLRIVDRLQKGHEVVAMTGDGVNDAPALKKADVGIAMGIRGTDVARQASDIVLTDDNFASIIAAVEEGRRQLDNIYKFVRYLLSSNIGEVIAILSNIAIGGPLILIPVQILWINLVTDGPTAIALGLEPIEEGTMQRPPRPFGERILGSEALIVILGVGAYVGLAGLYLFQAHLGTGEGEDLARARTLAFTGLIVAEKINVLNFRSLRTSFFRQGLRGNPLLLLAMSFALALQLCAIYVPPLQRILGTTAMSLADWGLVFLVCAPVLLIGEVLKLVVQKLKNSPGASSHTEGSSAL